MVLQGIVLLIAGVSIVFLFLSLLVAVLSLSAKIIPRFNHILPDEEPRVKTRKTQHLGPKHGTSPDEEIAVAIAAAVAHQRCRG